MPYLIDGHNLIPRVPGVSLRTIDDERQLIELLQKFCRQTGKRVEVYFDNAPPGQAQREAYGRVTAHFVRRGATADNTIRRRLRQLGREAPNWTVVSSDGDVAQAAREARATPMTADAFARLLVSGIQGEDRAVDTDPEMSADEVAAWLQLFETDGEDESDARNPP